MSTSRSASEKSNRASTDGSGKVSRHTSGSTGYDEHRIKLKRKLGHDSSFLELYCDTHLEKEDKKEFWGGQYKTIKSRIYGMGSSDLHFVVKGRSTSSSHGSSYPTPADYERLQERVRDLEERQSQVASQIDDMQAQFKAQMDEIMRPSNTNNSSNAP